MRCLFVNIVDWTKWDALRFEFRSWAWQMQNLYNCAGPLAPGVRAFQKGPIDSIPKLCATAAWFDLQRSDLEDTAKEYGVDIKRYSTLFDFLFALTIAVLKLPEKDIVDILEQRFAHYLEADRSATDILAVDEAAKVLDEADRDDLRRTQQSAESRQVDLENFRRSYTNKRQQVGGGRISDIVREVKANYKAPKSSWCR